MSVGRHDLEERRCCPGLLPLGVLLLFPSVVLGSGCRFPACGDLCSGNAGEGTSCILFCWVEVVVPGRIVSSDQLVIFEDPLIPRVFKGEVAVSSRQPGGRVEASALAMSAS